MNDHQILLATGGGELGWFMSRFRKNASSISNGDMNISNGDMNGPQILLATGGGKLGWFMSPFLKNASSISNGDMNGSQILLATGAVNLVGSCPHFGKMLAASRMRT